MALVSAQMTGVNSVVAALQGKTPAGKKVVNAEVGYTAPYALYVHENLQASHPNGGQAKFLEQPLRTEVATMQQIIRTSIVNKDGITTAITRAANHLKKESQKLVPVRTGFLQSSAFVTVK